MSKTWWLQRSAAVILVSGQLSGCTSWRVETLSPADVVERQQPGEVRVQRTDRQYEVFYLPEVQGDSLLGRRRWNTKHPDRAVALADVKGIATRHVHAGRTAGLVLGIGAIVGIIVGLGSMQGTFDNWGQ